MGSPRRAHRDQESRVDIKDRLQALAKPSSGARKSLNSTNDKTASKSQNSSQSGRNHGRNNKLPSRKDSMERVMERARTEGGNRWTKKLLDEEAKDPDRWGHSGFKEMYKNELGISKSRRSRSREKTSARRSRSRDYAHKMELGRTTNNPERSGGGSGQRKNVRSQVKISFSSSERSPNSDSKRRTDANKRPSNGASHERKFLSDKVTKANTTRTSRLDLNKKPTEQRRELATRKDRVVKKKSPLRSRSRSPLRHTEKNNDVSKKPIGGLKTKSNTRRGPVSPPERGRSYSCSPSRSSTSPVTRRRNCLSDDASSRSSSSQSHSSFSRSSSSSSSSSESSTSSSSKETAYRKRSTLKPKSPPAPSRMKLKEQLRSTQELHTAKQASVTKTVKRPISASNKVVSQVKKRREQSDSESSSNESSSETEDEDIEEGEEEEDGEDTGEGPKTAKEIKSGNLGSRLSLSERFGKLAQLSSQRRNLELVQLRIVAPVGGAATTEKNVSIDETSAAPVISNAKAARERSMESIQPPINHHHQTKHVHPPEEPIRKDERAREDRWRDWHERYDQYRHVQPPRQLPRDWDDIRVRHKYYTDRGYFGHDMTLEELSRWEAWWHRYQLWRRGYEHAWVKTHGPHVPVEYPDWTNYRSTNNRGEIAQPSSMSSSIRSRLGWRR